VACVTLFSSVFILASWLHLLLVLNHYQYHDFKDCIDGLPLVPSIGLFLAGLSLKIRGTFT
jgi:hypothetical protein